MKRQLLFIATALITLTSILQEVRGETVTQTRVFDRTGGNLTLTFNLIDTAFGRAILESDIVRITLTATINQSAASVGVENIGADGTPVNVSEAVWEISGWFSSSSITLPSDIGGNYGSPTYNKTVNFDPFTVSQDNTWNTPITTGATGILGGDILDSNYINYLGEGTFSIRLDVIQMFNIVASGPYQQSSTSSSLWGNVTITYEVIPEPSTMALAGLALVGVAALQRRRQLCALR